MSTENAQQIEHWDGEGGKHWVEGQERMDAVLAPFSRLLLEAAPTRSGERVLDVGCGCGDTSLAFADRGAEVLGVDVSGPMLARARARAEGRPGVRFVQADAAEHPFDAGSFELLVSRFGVMFFADPAEAFANLRSGHAEGGRLAFVCWQGPERNPWLTVPIQAAAPFAPEAEPPIPGTPGPFGFADPDRVRSILGAAGYRDVVVEPHAVAVRYGADLDDAMELVTLIGPVSRVLAVLPSEAHGALLEAVREALRPFETPEGLVMGSGAFIVTARA